MPPVDADHQRMVAPELAVALNVTAPLPHLPLGVVPVIVGSTFIVAVTGVRDDEIQPVVELYASA